MEVVPGVESNREQAGLRVPFRHPEDLGRFLFPVEVNRRDDRSQSPAPQGEKEVPYSRVYGRWPSSCTAGDLGARYDQNRHLRHVLREVLRRSAYALLLGCTGDIRGRPRRLSRAARVLVEIGERPPRARVCHEQPPPRLGVGPSRSLQGDGQTVPDQIQGYGTVEIEPPSHSSCRGEQPIDRGQVETGGIVVCIDHDQLLVWNGYRHFG